MRTTTTLLTAACLSASLAFAAAPVRAADNSANAGAQVTHPIAQQEKPNYTFNYPPGIQAKDLKAIPDVQKSFEKVAQSAFGKDPLNDIISYTVDQDRNRLKASDDNKHDNGDALTGIVKQLDSAWHTKYNQNFAFDGSKIYLETFLHVGTGEVTNPDQLVGKWPLPAGDNLSSGAGELTPADARQAHKTFGGDVNLEKGRDVAIAHISQSHGMPGVTASLIHEMPNTWRFDVPNTLTRQKLYSNLVANLTHLYNNQAQWPADAAEGYRAATQAVVASLYDINLDQARNNMPQANRMNNNTPNNTMNNNTANNR